MASGEQSCYQSILGSVHPSPLNTDSELLLPCRIKIFLHGLEEFVIDVQQAYKHTAFFLSKFIEEGLLSLFTVGSLLIHDDELVEQGAALKVLVAVLKNLKEESGERGMSETFNGSGLDLKDFAFSDRDRESLEKLLLENGLASIIG